MEVFPGISMDSRIRFGKPCLAGTRIDVATVLGGLAGGVSVERTSCWNTSFHASRFLQLSGMPLT